jgi:hypothetical protein
VKVQQQLPEGNAIPEGMASFKEEADEERVELLE